MLGHLQLFGMVYGKTLSILIIYTLALKSLTFWNISILTVLYILFYLNIEYQDAFAWNHIIII